MKYSQADIQNLLRVSNPHRMQMIFRYAGISNKAIADAHGCTPTNVTLVLSGTMPSQPLKQTAHRLLQERLGDLCPSFDEVFGEATKSAANM